MKLFNIKKLLSRKGFTLIELLVVIAVLGVLSAAIVAAINPLAKINQATDSNTKNNIAQVAGALQAYYTSQATPAYPAGLASLVTNELKALPPTAGWVYATSTSGGASLYAPLKITTATETVWCWKSDGTAPSAMAATSCTAP